MKPLPIADLDHVLQCAPWEELRGGRLFLTGATGFFGSWLLESFCHANDRLRLDASAVVLTRDAAAFLQKMPHLAGRSDLAFHRGDVREFDFSQGQFSHIIHGATAASAALNEAAPREMYETIVHGARRALDFARHCRAGRLLLLSSGAIYGVQPPEIFGVNEDFSGAPDPLDIRSAYGQGKRAAEYECTLATHEGAMEITIARCYAFVGPHLPLEAHFAAGNFLRDVLAGRTIEVGGDGTPVRSYLYAADLAVWLWTLLVRGESGRAYNVGSDEAISIAQLARCCAVLRRPACRVRIARESEPGALPTRYVPDVTRARRELGLNVQITLDDALHRTYQWLTES